MTPAGNDGSYYHDDNVEDGAVRTPQRQDDDGDKPNGRAKGTSSCWLCGSSYSWCFWCCCCCCCPNDPASSSHRHRHCKPWRVLSWLVVTAAYWAVLWIVASSYSPGNHQFTLNVGETWQVVPPPNLWSRTSLRIHSTSAATADPGLEVYQFMPVLDYSSQKQGQVSCPPLQGGPVLTLHEPMKHVIMDMEGYQYDYFHLNQGSVLSVDARLQSLTSGTINLYLLQGYHALASLEEHDSVQDFRGESILKRFLGQGGSTVMEYTVPSSDYYIVVYDNAAAGVTKLDVAITVQMATHSLPDSEPPICTAHDAMTVSAADGGGGCRWPLSSNDDRQRIAGMCLIVKAVSAKLEKAEERQHQSGPIPPSPPGEGPPGGDSGPPKLPLDFDDVQVVVVQVDAPLGSPMLLLLTVLPLVVMLGAWLMNHGTTRCCQKDNNNVDAAMSRRSMGTTASTAADVLDHRLVVLGAAAAEDDERTPLTTTGWPASSYYSRDNDNDDDGTNGSSSNRRIFPLPPPPPPPTTTAAKGAVSPPLARSDTPEIRPHGLDPVPPPPHL